MTGTIHVAILDDHQSIIDGFLYRLADTPEIKVVATASFGEALEPLLAVHSVDVLILDIGVPTAADNANPYPILHLLPKLIEQYPALNVLVISMHSQRTLIKGVMEAGASGYVLKDDRRAIEELAAMIRTVAGGGVYFSQRAYQLYQGQAMDERPLSARQLEVLALCAAYPDESASELARRLNVAHSTVRNLLSGVYTKLNVRTRTAAVDRARQLGIVTPLAQMEEEARRAEPPSGETQPPPAVL
jgi:two-component system nitrate/nitrite response regulator NarL